MSDSIKQTIGCEVVRLLARRWIREFTPFREVQLYFFEQESRVDDQTIWIQIDRIDRLNIPLGEKLQLLKAQIGLMVAHIEFGDAWIHPLIFQPEPTAEERFRQQQLFRRRIFLFLEDVRVQRITLLREPLSDDIFNRVSTIVYHSIEDLERISHGSRCNGWLEALRQLFYGNYVLHTPIMDGYFMQILEALDRRMVQGARMEELDDSLKLTNELLELMEPQLLDEIHNLNPYLFEMNDRFRL